MISPAIKAQVVWGRTEFLQRFGGPVYVQLGQAKASGAFRTYRTAPD